MSSFVSVKRSPGTSWIGSGAIFPSRIFGPGRSAMIATRRPVARCGVADAPDEFRVMRKVAVRKIQPRDIQPRANKPLEHLRRFRRRPDGGDDLGFMLWE